MILLAAMLTTAQFSCLFFNTQSLLPQRAGDRGHLPQTWKAATGKEPKKSVVTFSWPFFSPQFCCVFCFVILMSPLLSLSRPFVVISHAY